MSHKKFGPDRFSRFDVYWIQTDRQTNTHPDKPNLFIDERSTALGCKNVGIRKSDFMAKTQFLYHCGYNGMESSVS